MKNLTALLHSYARYFRGWFDRMVFGRDAIATTLVGVVSAVLGLYAGLQLVQTYAPALLETLSLQEASLDALALLGDANFNLVLIGTLLSVFSLASLATDVANGIALLRYDLHIAPSGTQIEDAVGRAHRQAGQTLVELNGQALITDREANLRLNAAANPIVLDRDRFELPRPIDRYKSNLLLKAPGTKADTFNSAKIRLASTISRGAIDTASPIRLQRTEYFLDRLSNNLSRSVINYRGYPFIEPIRWNIASNGLLRAFEESPFSNQLGGSCIVLTADGQIVYVRQGSGSDENAQRLAPSGSGSFDWRDGKAVRTLQQLALHGIEREVEEEIGADLGRLERLHWLTGFGRYLYRGGKPEFFSLMILKGASLDVRPQEWDYINRTLIRRGFDRNIFATKRALCGALEEFRDELAADKATSGPLYFSVVLAIDFVGSRAFQIGQLRDFLRADAA